jgi:O-antigen ligase
MSLADISLDRRVGGETAPDAGLAGSVLFFLTFLFVWVTTDPFPSLARTFTEQASGSASNPINQLLAVGLLVALVAYALQHRRLGMLIQPRLLLAMLFGWLLVTSFGAPDPVFALRRLIMASVLIVAAAVTLHLPRNEPHFARLIGSGILLVLVLCYAGVLFLPARAIHQATDFLEPALAGDWRGLYPHKNAASEIMSISVLIGLYVSRSWSRPLGIAISVLAVIFLLKAGGKTALSLLPIVLTVVWATERWPRARALIVWGCLIAYGALTIGTATIPSIEAMLAKTGFDASFTGRVDIWKLALGAIAEQPVFGYGYQSFWQSDAVVSAFRETPTWAAMAVSAHSAYLEILLSSGVPGLVLALIWLVVVPLRDIGRAEANGNSPHLTRLFKRLWLYVLLTGFLESIFLLSAGAIWFMMVMAVLGLRLQATATLKSGEPSHG